MIIGKKLLNYGAIDSTNSEARRLIAQGSGEGLVIVANEQTKGRGKPGSRWLSPKGNLYFSAVISPRKNLCDLPSITIFAALAVRSLIAKLCKLPVVIKWPNDLLIRGKKVGGVLVERLASGQIIIGIGLNLNVIPAGVPATSLKRESSRKFSVSPVVGRLIRELDAAYLEYLGKV